MLSQLSEAQIYLVSTHLTLYLWIGKKVEPLFKKGSLRILKSFMLSTLKERINYVPDYLKEVDCYAQSMELNGLGVGFSDHNLKLRMESQGAESQRFRSLLGRRNVVPGAEDRIDYFMLRRKRNAYYA